MVTRQRRTRSRSNNINSSTVKGSRGTLSRRVFLLSILAVTTAIFFSLLISRYKSGNSASGRLIASVLGRKSKSNQIPGNTAIGRDGSQGEDVKRRIAAIADRFKEEIGSLISGEEEEEEGNKRKGNPKGEAVVVAAAAGGLSAVPDDQNVDHEQNDLLRHAPHIAEKTDKEALEDQRAALQDLDQETIKAMFDALYARG